VRWHATYAELFAAIDQARAVAADERVPDAPMTHPLEDYVGTYAADGYADFSVKREGESLLAWIAGAWYPLEHHHYDIFNLDLSRFEERILVHFLMNAQGEIDALSLPLEPQVDPIVFKRKPIAIDADRLAKLAGCYALPIEGMELAVVLKQDRLFMAVTGQAEQELLPRRAAESSIEFQVKSAVNVQVAFQVDAQGACSQAILKEPNQVFAARRVPGEG
jgi:hypothetical protein